MKDKKFKSILSYYKWYIVLFLFLFLIYLVICFVADILTVELIASVEDDLDATKKALLFVAIATLVFVFFELMSDLVLYNLLGKLTSKYLIYLNEHLRKLQTNAIESSSSGAINAFVVSDPCTLLNNLNWMTQRIGYGLYHFASTAYVFYLNVYFGFFMLAVFAKYIIVEICLFKRNIKMNKAYRRTSIAYDSLNIETINSHQDIKALNTAKPLYEKQKRAIKNLDTGRYKYGLFNTYRSGGLNALWEIYVGLIPVILAIILQHYVFALASLIFVFKNATMMRYLYWDISYILMQLSVIRAKQENIDEFLNDDIYPIDKYGDIEIERLKGDIEFKNVAFGYQYKYYKENQDLDYDQIWQEEKNKKMKVLDSKKDDRESEYVKKQVFKNLNFKIKAGQTVAFVGESGSGKTTILNLIAKFSTVDSGEVLLDGVNINDLTKKTLRNNICMVSQNTYIFNGTIKENLLLVKNDATDEEIMQACEKAYMKDFLNELEKGIDTVVGENGIKLSGGQKQRLAIARAFLKDSQIVIFDESTSALDNQAQAFIQESISQFEGKTVIIVAHRLSTIVNADCIYYLQEGEIACSGKFNTLMRKDESFRELFMTENL